MIKCFVKNSDICKRILREILNTELPIKVWVLTPKHLSDSSIKKWMKQRKILSLPFLILSNGNIIRDVLDFIKSESPTRTKSKKESLEDYLLAEAYNKDQDDENGIDEEAMSGGDINDRMAKFEAGRTKLVHPETKSGNRMGQNQDKVEQPIQRKQRQHNVGQKKSAEDMFEERLMEEIEHSD